MRTPRACLILLNILVVSGVTGQEPRRTAFGIGFSATELTSGWRYEEPYGTGSLRVHRPWHIHSRLQLLAYIDKPLRLSSKGLGLSFRGEIAAGIAGGTKEDWLPAGETISTGGSTLSLNTYLRVARRVSFLPASLTFFTGLGISLTYLTANGEGADETTYAASSSYRYSEGWEETLYLPFIPVGVAWDGPAGKVSLEIRFPLAGDGETDWDPAGRAVQIGDGAFYSAAVLSYGFGK